MRPNESFVGQPIRSLQTMLRVISKNNPSIPTVVPDGIYGQNTMNSVSAFQRHHSLPVTGIADQTTWDAIVEAYEDALIFVGPAAPIPIHMNPNQIYRLGDSGANIMLLQAMLAYISQKQSCQPAPSLNGVMDVSTSEALAAFQVLCGLKPIGELDCMTWKYLVHQFSLLANREDQLLRNG